MTEESRPMVCTHCASPLVYGNIDGVAKWICPRHKTCSICGFEFCTAAAHPGTVVMCATCDYASSHRYAAPSDTKAKIAVPPIVLSSTTEFDVALTKLKRTMFFWLGIGVVGFLVIEAILIFILFTEANVIRMQTFNGAMVMAGGVTLISITSLLLILPTKLIAYEALKMARDTSKSMERLVVKADKFMADSKVILEDVQKAAQAFTKPIPLPPPRPLSTKPPAPPA